MPAKQFQLTDDLNVTVYKRRSSRSLRLSIAADGRVRVSIPTWVPYHAGVEFARSRAPWIAAQLPSQQLLEHGAAIGKAHHLYLQPGEVKTVRTRLKGGQILVTYPVEAAEHDPAVQQAAQRACVRALRSQAEQLLPQRLESLADIHGFSYRSVRIKELKSRWGSCDSRQNIVLNLYLMQLPWECIDYVLLHELTHTRVMRHGSDFWTAMQTVLPAVKTVKRSMRAYQPTLFVA